MCEEQDKTNLVEHHIRKTTRSLLNQNPISKKKRNIKINKENTSVEALKSFGWGLAEFRLDPISETEHHRGLSFQVLRRSLQINSEIVPKRRQGHQQAYLSPSHHWCWPTAASWLSGQTQQGWGEETRENQTLEQRPFHCQCNLSLHVQVYYIN